MKPIKGRGVLSNPDNQFNAYKLDYSNIEGTDAYEQVEQLVSNYHFTRAKSIVNAVKSPDIPVNYSINPYQGCEHGCTYCYARKTHEYWEMGTGLSFESNIIIKENAPKLLEEFFQKEQWKGAPIMLSGNTDCYQPAERTQQITRKLLQVFMKYRNPVSIITKNHLILRDLDILVKLLKYNLINVNISINSLNENLRMKMEPRTSIIDKRFDTVRKLSAEGIPVNVLIAPIIPGLNDHEIPEILKRCSESGASSAKYVLIRLNEGVKDLFYEWLNFHYRDRSAKVKKQIKSLHSGKDNSSDFFNRLGGTGKYALYISSMFNCYAKKYNLNTSLGALNSNDFLTNKKGQLPLF